MAAHTPGPSERPMTPTPETPVPDPLYGCARDECRAEVTYPATMLFWFHRPCARGRAVAGGGGAAAVGAAMMRMEVCRRYAANRTRTPHAFMILWTVSIRGMVCLESARERPARLSPVRRASSATPPTATATLRSAMRRSSWSLFGSSKTILRYAAMALGVSRYSLVLWTLTGMSFLLFVGFPVRLGSLDILGLTLLSAARQQHDDVLSRAAVVDPVSRTVTDPQLGETSSEFLVITKVFPTHSIDALQHAGTNAIVLSVEPFAKGVLPVDGNVVNHLKHDPSVYFSIHLRQGTSGWGVVDDAHRGGRGEYS